jgi:nucleotide exchange factor SIL1
MDTFLDQNMGAKLGVWPTQKQDNADSTRCGEPEHAVKDACWQYHLEKMEADAGNEGHEWLAEFLKLLRSSKGVAGDSSRKGRDREL